MKYFCNAIEQINLLNIDSSVLMYYDKEEHDFVPLEWDTPVPETCIELPYAQTIETVAMREFWARMGHDKWDCPDTNRFRAYIRRHGLEEDFDLFESNLVIPYMKEWAKVNEIQLCWDNYCAY